MRGVMREVARLRSKVTQSKVTGASRTRPNGFGRDWERGIRPREAMMQNPMTVTTTDRAAWGRIVTNFSQRLPPPALRVSGDREEFRDGRGNLYRWVAVALLLLFAGCADQS